MARAEQICRHATSPGHRRHLKRRAARLWRRAAKRDPEAAPVRLRGVIRGWAD